MKIKVQKTGVASVELQLSLASNSLGGLKTLF